MGRDRGSRFDARWVRLAGLAAALTLAGAGLSLVPDLYMTLPHTVRDRIVERALWGMLFGYWAALVLSVVAGAALVAIVVRARRTGRRRPVAARMLLLCAGTLFGLAMVEAGSASWLAWAHRFPDLPTDLPGPPPGELVIAVVGESSAMGSPYGPLLSIGQIAAWKLQEALGGPRVTADVLAVPGVALERQHQILEEIRRRPDALIIYAGHNEFQARFDWDRDASRILGGSLRPIDLLMQVGEWSPACRLITEEIRKFRLRQPPKLMQHDLIDPPIALRAEYEAVRQAFGRRLEAIVSWCDRVGTLPILVIPPGNDAGFEPNRSVVPEATTAAGRRALARDFWEARASESDPPRAMARYRALIDRQPGFAEAHFRLARLLERSGRYDEANRHYVLARDLDGFPQRCVSSFQDCYRRVAARHGCILIDGPAEFRALSAHGILDDGLFHDAQHPNLRGHAALAQAVLRELRAREAFGWTRGVVPAIDPASCAAHFGVDRHAWEDVCKWSAFFFDVTATNRFDPAERLAWKERYLDAQKRIAAGTAPEDVGIPGVGLGPGRSEAREAPRPAAVDGPPPGPRAAPSPATGASPSADPVRKGTAGGRV
jgi:tetratricopeptide (TPR) repeat protein